MMQDRHVIEREATAVRDDVLRVTGGRPMQWVVVHEVAQRLGLADEVAVDAVKSAVGMGWLVADGNPPHSVRLCRSLLQQKNPLEELS